MHALDKRCHHAAHGPCKLRGHLFRPVPRCRCLTGRQAIDVAQADAVDDPDARGRDERLESSAKRLGQARAEPLVLGICTITIDGSRVTVRSRAAEATTQPSCRVVELPAPSGVTVMFHELSVDFSKMG